MRAIIILLLVSMMVGCASVGIDKDEYNQKIRNISIGTSKTDFYGNFPDAVPRGAKKYSQGTVEVLEVNVAHFSWWPTGNKKRNALGMEGHPQWFYFYNDKLIQYGQPNDWPAEPDKIIEIRER